MARNAPTIDSYGAGGFRLAGDWRTGSVLIVGDAAQAWPVASPSDLTLESLGPVLDAGRAEVELLLLGMGASNALLVGSGLCFLMILGICIAIPQLWHYRS